MMPTRASLQSRKEYYTRLLHHKTGRRVAAIICAGYSRCFGSALPGRLSGFPEGRTPGRRSASRSTPIRRLQCPVRRNLLFPRAPRQYSTLMHAVRQVNVEKHVQRSKLHPRPGVIPPPNAVESSHPNRLPVSTIRPRPGRSQPLFQSNSRATVTVSRS